MPDRPAALAALSATLFFLTGAGFGSAVTVAIEPASAAPVASDSASSGYEVVVIRCPGGPPNVFLDYAALADASQRQVDSVAYSASHVGVDAQVRLARITSPTTSVLVSKYDQACP